MQSHNAQFKRAKELSSYRDSCIFLFTALFNDTMIHGSNQTILLFVCQVCDSFFPHTQVPHTHTHTSPTGIHTHMHKLITSFSQRDEPHLSQLKMQ